MKKILVVDDSALMRRMMCDIIESDQRFQVVDKATNGLEALDFLTKNTYDAVVLDVNMPKMTGIQLHGGPNAPIVRDYKISGIPRFFLLDRDGNIINTDMSRPSDANTVKVFDELPGL